MEIKKGISQMAEYPNVEINYVVPENGNMYYVMRDGVLENGAIIATLDPKHAIDESNHCDNMGVFSENGTILVDFNKKEIRKITDNLVLAVASKPESKEVNENLGRINDEISKAAIEDNANTIINKLKDEMGSNGEIIFEDSYGEANVYSLDSYNNKIGLDCSFIGKNEKGLYFHTTDLESETKFVIVDEFKQNNPEETSNEENKEEITVSFEDNNNEVEDVKDVENVSSNEDNDSGLNIEIDQDILAGFKNNEEDVNQIEPDEIDKALKNDEANDSEEKADEETENEVEQNEKDDDDVGYNENGVFESAIDTINKLVEETKKLSARIVELEEKLKEQEEMMNSEEKKKDELNDTLDRANEVLENIK